MNSIKAISTGVVFTVVAILLMQLVYLITSVGYKNIANHYPYLNNISGIFGYLIIISVLLLIMFVGGYLTAIIAKTKEILHTLVVGSITTTLMMWTAFQNSGLTTTAIIISSLMLIATIMGGLYCKKKHTPPLLHGS